MTPRPAHIGDIDKAWRRSWIWSVCLTVGLPTLLAYNLPPSATFLNQAVALIGWGLSLMVLTGTLQATRLRALGDGLEALLCALALLAFAALASPFWAHLPATLSLSSAGMFAAAMLVLLVAAKVQRQGQGIVAFEALCFALLIAGTLSALIGIVQIYAPELTGNPWIAAASGDRAGGNLRQANHLSSLLLWSIVAAIWLGGIRRVPGAAVIALCALMLFGVVLSGSRTGMVGTLLLALWGIVDTRLSRPARMLLWLLPLGYAVFWGGMALWAQSQNQVFDGAVRLQQADLSSNRFGIWSNSLSLIAAHPWAGVGFGEFNFAWTLTPFPGRPQEFFDHAHNIVLQFAVELGLPLATLVLTLLMWALFEAFKVARDESAEGTPHLRPAFVMVLLMAVHSQLEYPLWYAYFLLPTAFAFGLCLGGTPIPSAPANDAPPNKRPRIRFLLIGALLMTLGSIASVWDYLRVKEIFAPSDDTVPLSQRIIEGRRSWFFAHHADYAAATVVQHPSQVMAAFARAPHYLLDTRLMMAWATALHESGDDDRARYIAQRLREFKNPTTAEFFAPCDKPPAAGESLPYQCLEPSRPLTYLDFR